MNLLLPIIVLFVIVVLFAAAARDSNGNERTVYDERQKAIINEGYRIAAVVGIILNIIFGLLFAWDDHLPFDASFAMIAVVMIVSAVYASYCIFHGAYFGIKNKWKQSTVMVCILAVVDTVFGMMQTNSAVGLDGCLTLMNSCTLMIGITFAVIAISIFIQRIRERKSQE